MKNARTLANAFIVKWPFRREMCAAYARRVDRLATSPVVASHRCRQSLDKSQLLEMKYFRIVGRRAPEKSVCAVNHLRPALLGSAAQIETPSLCPACQPTLDCSVVNCCFSACATCSRVDGCAPGVLRSAATVLRRATLVS